MGDKQVAMPLAIQDNGETEETQSDMYTSTGIRNHEPSVWAGEEISYALQPLKLKNF
jgi:hypothetical protein